MNQLRYNCLCVLLLACMQPPIRSSASAFSTFLPRTSSRLSSRQKIVAKDTPNALKSSVGLHSDSLKGYLAIPANPVPFSKLSLASVATHYLLWVTTTLAFRFMMPLVQRLLLQKNTDSYEKLEKFLVENHHEQFEALSPICWAVHVAGQTLLSITALHVLLPVSNSAPVRALGGITAFNAAGGCLLIGSHGLIHRQPTMEKFLDFSGTRVVRAASAATGTAMLFPQFALPSTAIIFLLAALEKVTFSNPLGQILGIIGIATQLMTKGLTVPYKLAVLSMFFIIPFLPESQYDKGHTLVAGTISIPYLVLLFFH